MSDLILKKFVIAIQGTERTRYVRRSGRPVKLYVTGVNYKNHDGFSINSFSYGKERAAAVEFAKFTAQKISQQLNGPEFRTKSTVEEANAG